MIAMIADIIRPLDLDRLRQQMQEAAPFGFCVVDGFLRDDFAAQVEDSFPMIAEAKRNGGFFATVNERNKVQVSNPISFPEPIAHLNAALASPEWLGQLSQITGIRGLLADEELSGAGIHEMGNGGYLDPHVDFAVLSGRGLFRRLNMFVYFNSDWAPGWGGDLEFWDPRVQRRMHVLAPLHNRCVIFTMMPSSFHSVSRLHWPQQQTRKSFAAYYYTSEPAPEWSNPTNCTTFRALPGERMKRFVLMPAEQAYRRARRHVGEVLRSCGLR